MKKIVQIICLGVVLAWTSFGFSNFESISQIEGTWVGQVDENNCIFPSMAKFITLDNIVTGIIREVGSWSSETCTPSSYYVNVFGEGFIKTDSETIIFPKEGGFIEFQLSDDGNTLTGKAYFSGKLYSKYELFRDK
ncbi:MAG: hypothetical protein A2Z91_08780 [Deltaproteobacteria bacterium GWA2_38_16]|nr:MAG: hypothetical protein A2Z91_08780 [Deltaproteobacteria bacterium GWA2_38_16]OGQ03889.1 MAG: hypothetical protein A3D19_07345 [Deltaproteobacteria bacterium RIFCSPHIGHO2_02_FULL_38_15]OGQ30133.1 MAG: hypothetical protein A3A72_07595 [Deltaproteobacteria bacterium RIFCSPLOWO2_01_FULL_38_9]HBQ20935.1 hypothetical protein [Deltaproteobacteria bacterium]